MSRTGRKPGSGSADPAGADAIRQGQSRMARGRQAEDAVAAMLAGSGWSLVARNWRRGRGELDIVAFRDGTLAVVEVKAVDGLGLESLSRSVGTQKQRRIIETSKLFVSMYREFEYATVRYDVASVRSGEVADYFENAFVERT